jgi:RHS repeat-associated protein
LGSTSITTNPDGDLISEIRYTPWGEVRSGSSSTKYQYTGQYNEGEIDLLWYSFRHYDPELGHFVQPDSLVSDPANSQSFNRYSYVNNSPLNYNDPTGHKPCWATKKYTCNLTADDIEDLLQSDEGTDFLNNLLKETNTIVIFACGMGLNLDCKGGKKIPFLGKDYASYGGVQPLYYYSYGLSNIKYFGAGSQTLAEYQQKIADYILANSNSNFILVGHSLGADAILGAMNIIHNLDSSNYSRIKGVMLLDAGAGVNRTSNEGIIKGLRDAGVPVALFHSQEYLNAIPGTITLSPSSVLAPDAAGHLDMAVNPNVFLQSGPIFYSWILMLGQ